MSLRSVLTESFLNNHQQNSQFPPSSFEIEAKIGILNQINNSNTPTRINFPISTPALYSDKSFNSTHTKFSSNVECTTFYSLLQYHLDHFPKYVSVHYKIDQIFSTYESGRHGMKTKSRAEASIDHKHFSNTATSQLSWDPRNNSQKLLEYSQITSLTTKNNLQHHNIIYPSKNFDFRISFNTETTQPISDSIKQGMNSMEPDAIRFKKRYSVLISFFSFDFTVVDSLYFNNRGRSSKTGLWEQSFEIEIELQSKYLTTIFSTPKTLRNKLYDVFSQLISNSIRIITLSTDGNIQSLPKPIKVLSSTKSTSLEEEEL